ncbi:MAG: hypothetical protein K9G67_06565 [Bacteroidales bacterium]|nr:hypothetical protein [Bacteroidales bacterium]MCF8343029.1 hypothetical protein [Bacteroidales bacterium]MCF8350269.1 hypothetical protein [Bacteroidales bacterium]MCF8376001.1 hypothetical protein [Bacteroidales bacterium]MCF8400489.1 hypothetical protein [Bacteroidales bacterium]
MKLIYNILLFAAYALSSGFGLILLKRAVTDKKFALSFKEIIRLINTELIIGFVLYAVGFICWMVILSKLKLNVAFPVAMSLFFIVSAMGSYFILKEPLTFKTLAGMLVCLVGIILITVK